MHGRESHPRTGSSSWRPLHGPAAVFPIPRQRLAVIGGDDQSPTVAAIRRSAERLNWPHLYLSDLAEVGWAVTVNHPAAVVLTDLGGHQATLDVLTTLRRVYTGPLVVVDDLPTASVVAALVAGADTVLRTEIRDDEIGARLLALVRRTAEGSESGARFLSAPGLEVDLWRKEATLESGPLSLSSTEFRLLVCLMKNAGQIVPLKRILQQVWGWADADLNTLRIYITRLRKALGESAAAPRFVTSVRGHGYMFAQPVMEAADRETDLVDQELPMMPRLADKCAELAATNDIRDAASRICQGLVTEGTVDAVGLHLSDGKVLKLIGHFGFTTEWQDIAREVALADTGYASTQSVLRAQPVQILRRNAHSFPRTSAANAAELPGAFLFVPMIYAGTAIGTMGVVRHSDEPFGPLTVSYLQAVAALCGTCLGARWVPGRESLSESH